MFASNFPQKNTFFLNDELLKCSFLFRYSELKLNMLSVFSSLSIKSGVIWFWCFLSRRAEIFCPLFFDAGGVSWIIVKLFHKKLSPVGAVEYFKLRLLTKTFEGFFLFEFTLYFNLFQLFLLNCFYKKTNIINTIKYLKEV